MNLEDDYGRERISHTPAFFAKRLGYTFLSMTVAYMGLKVGEDIFHFALPYAVDIGVSTAVGSAPVNVRYAVLERQNNSPEQ